MSLSDTVGGGRASSTLRGVVKVLRGCLLVATLTIPGVASAQSSAGSADAGSDGGAARVALTASRDEASGRALFLRGVGELGASRFAEAARLFEESYRANPVPVALFNLAYAYRGLGRTIDAISAIERFLGNPENTPADRVEAARTELASLRAAVARVRLSVDPERASVRVDGRVPQVRDGEIEIDPGRRVLEISLSGYRSERREISLAPSARVNLAVTLAVLDQAARLRIEPGVANARVSIDGAFVGLGVVDRLVSPGSHRVVIEADGYLRFERRVTVDATGLLRVDPALQRPRPSPWPWLGPVIGVSSAAVVTVVTYLLVDALSSEGPPTLPADAWGPPLR